MLVLNIFGELRRPVDSAVIFFVDKAVKEHSRSYVPIERKPAMEVGDLLDVESVLAGGQAGDLGLNVDGSGLVLLGEDDGALDLLVVGTENATALTVILVCWCTVLWREGGVCFGGCD